MTKIIFIPNNKKIHESENLLRWVIEYLGLKSHHNAKKMGILFFRNAESKAYRKNTFPLEDLKGYKYVFISSSELDNLNIRIGNDVKILNKDDESDLIEVISKSWIFELTGVPLGYLAFARRVWGVESGQYEFDLIEISRFGNNNLSKEAIISKIRDPESSFWKGYHPMVFSRKMNAEAIPKKIRESWVGGWVKLEIKRIWIREDRKGLEYPFGTYEFVISDPSEDKDDSVKKINKLVIKEFKIYDELLNESEARYASSLSILKNTISSIVQDAKVIVNVVGQWLSVSYERKLNGRTEDEIAMFYDIGRDYWTAWSGTDHISKDAIVILSHWHYDHYQAYFRGKLKSKLKESWVTWILPTDNGPLSPTAKKILTDISTKKPKNFVFLKQGDCILSNNSFHIFALQPTDLERNNHGIAIFDESKNYLLPWDACYDLIFSQSLCCGGFHHHSIKLCKTKPLTTIVATHHGWSYTPGQLPVVDRVIFSYGKNTYKHPDPQRKVYWSYSPLPIRDTTKRKKQLI